MKLDAQQAVSELLIVADILMDELSPGRQERVRVAIAFFADKYVYVSDEPLWHIAHPPVMTPDERRAICGSDEPAFGVWEKLPTDDHLASCCPKCNALHVIKLKKAYREAALRNAETHKERT